MPAPEQEDAENVPHGQHREDDEDRNMDLAPFSHGIVGHRIPEYRLLYRRSRQSAQLKVFALALHMLARAIKQQLADHAADHVDTHGKRRQPGQDSVEMNARMD